MINITRKNITLSGSDWHVVHSLPSEINPTVGNRGSGAGRMWGPDWIPAQVPGDVQSDALDAGLIPDPAYGMNSRACEWTYQRDWTYLKSFEAPVFTEGCTSAALVFDGVDHECDVFLNGKWLGRHEGAWTGFEFDVTGLLAFDNPNHLSMTVKHAPDEECQWGRTSAVRTLKARFAYGWDWCTRLVPLGIWKDVRLEYRGDAYLRGVRVRPAADPVRRTAVIKVTPDVVSADADFHGMIALSVEKAGREIATAAAVAVAADVADAAGSGVECVVDIPDPEFWYPNGYGAQPVYQAECRLYGENGTLLDSVTVETALRSLDFERTEGAGPDALPYLVKVNGKKIFLKGFNWTPVHQLYGRPRLERYSRRINFAAKAGCNFLRVWGGGLAERDEFYSMCTRAGILVMQELFQSSACVDNHPPSDAGYAEMLSAAAREVIRKVRNHASLAIWCGGNELCVRGDTVDIHGNILRPEAAGLEGYAVSVDGKSWVPLAPDHPALAALAKCLSEEDPDRLWLHTSASGPCENASLGEPPGRMHDVHGPWMNLGPGKHEDFYNRVDMMLHSEFGCDGAASLRIMRKYIGAGGTPLFPPDASNPAFWHHGRMWTETNLRRTEAYFGKISDIETYVMASRHVQAAGLGYAAEAHRRRKWRSAGAVIWHMAEPWPNACDTCVIDYDNMPKPAYYTLARAFRARHVSVKTVPGSDEASIWIHNSLSQGLTGRIMAEQWTPEGKSVSKESLNAAAPAESVSSAGNIKLRFDGAGKSGITILICTLLSADGTEISSSWSLHTNKSAEPLSGLKDLPAASIKKSMDNDGTLTITNTGEIPIIGLWLEPGEGDTGYLSDNWVCLLPGKSFRCRTEGQISDLSVSAWNLLQEY